MARLNNSSLDNIKDILNKINLNYNSEKEEQIKLLQQVWQDIIGHKISEFSRVYTLKSDGRLYIVCSDSIVANELYKEEKKLRDDLNKKLKSFNIEIKSLKFDYRNWEE